MILQNSFGRRARVVAVTAAMAVAIAGVAGRAQSPKLALANAASTGRLAPAGERQDGAMGERLFYSGAR